MRASFPTCASPSIATSRGSHQRPCHSPYSTVTKRMSARIGLSTPGTFSRSSSPGSSRLASVSRSKGRARRSTARTTACESLSSQSEPLTSDDSLRRGITRSSTSRSGARPGMRTVTVSPERKR
jgi:hypothetical protein